MSSFTKPALDAIASLVHSTWTDCTNSIQPTQNQYYNWRDRIIAGDLEVPYAVIVPGVEQPTSEYGVTVKTYLFDISVYYFRSILLSSGEAATYDRIEDIVWPKITALRDAIITYATDNDPHYFQLMEDPVCDLSHANAVNEMLRQVPERYYAGLVQFRVLVGETY